MKDKVINKISKHLAGALPGLYAIYLFGSELEENTRPESDVDLAILLKSGISSHTLFSLKNDLEAILKKDVDLIDLLKANEIFRAQILTQGRRIYTNDQYLKEIDDFEYRVLQSYIYLKENIRPILEEIQKSGSIYHN